jgi:hypothetical protein
MDGYMRCDVIRLGSLWFWARATFVLIVNLNLCLVMDGETVFLSWQRGMESALSFPIAPLHGLPSQL